MTKAEGPTIKAQAAAEKAAHAAKVAKLVKVARSELAKAATAEGSVLVKLASRYFTAGEAVSQSGESVRAFAILAEHGNREAFKATGLAQPVRLVTYRRAADIFAACDASGSDVSEAMATFVTESREADRDVSIAGFATYCAAGFQLPAAKASQGGEAGDDEGGEAGEGGTDSEAVSDDDAILLGGWGKRDLAKLVKLLVQRADGDTAKLYKLSDMLTDAADHIDQTAAAVAA